MEEEGQSWTEWNCLCTPYSHPPTEPRCQAHVCLHQSQQEAPRLETAAPSGPASTGPLAMGAGWQEASLEACSSLPQLI